MPEQDIDVPTTLVAKGSYIVRVMMDTVYNYVAKNHLLQMLNQLDLNRWRIAVCGSFRSRVCFKLIS